MVFAFVVAGIAVSAAQFAADRLVARLAAHTQDNVTLELGVTSNVTEEVEIKVSYRDSDGAMVPYEDNVRVTRYQRQNVTLPIAGLYQLYIKYDTPETWPVESGVTLLSVDGIIPAPTVLQVSPSDYATSNPVNVFVQAESGGATAGAQLYTASGDGCDSSPMLSKGDANLVGLNGTVCFYTLQNGVRSEPLVFRPQSQLATGNQRGQEDVQIALFWALVALLFCVICVVSTGLCVAVCFGSKAPVQVVLRPGRAEEETKRTLTWFPRAAAK